jgi:CPA2 family monovalent cation:H+ antiporter-2
MTPDAAVFRDLAYVLLAAVVGAVLARLARQPIIIGYVVGGILVSPLTPGVAVSDVHVLDAVAEAGVALLMFSLGVEFSLGDLRRVRWPALVGTPLGIAGMIALTVGVGYALGWPPARSFAIGATLSVASTMVAARLLADRGELRTHHARVLIGILIVEDLAVLILIVVMPVVGTLEGSRLRALAAAVGTALLVIIPFVLLARRVVPRLIGLVMRTRSEELFVLLALALAAGTAALTEALGLSLALGAFLGGLLVSESDYAHETLARLLPLRDTFVAIFFVAIGLLVDPAAVIGNLGLLGVMVGLVVLGNATIWTLVVRLCGEPLSTAMLVAIGLTQIGEFSFVLVRVARNAGHVGDEAYNAVLATALVTILVNAALVRAMPGWVGRLRLRRPPEPVEPVRLQNHVVLAGYGRVGGVLGEALDTFNRPYLVIENDPDIVRALRLRGVLALYGDAAQRSVLDRAGVSGASLLVLALPDVERVARAVRAARDLNPTVPVLARAQHVDVRERLLEAGASEVIQPELEAAATLVRHALERLRLPDPSVSGYLKRLRAADIARDDGAPPPEGLPHIRDVLVGGGRVSDQSLRESRLRELYGVTVLGVKRADGSAVTHPDANTIIRAGDRVIVFGLAAQIAAFVSAAAADASTEV